MILIDVNDLILNYFLLNSDVNDKKIIIHYYFGTGATKFNYSKTKIIQQEVNFKKFV